MSYDLIIATEKQVVLVTAAAQLRKVAGVDDVRVLDHQIEVLVTRSSGVTSSFFIGAASLSELNDFDETFLDYVRHPQWMIEITVPASAGEHGVGVARGAAIAIARLFKGAAFDPQEDGIFWPSRKLLVRSLSALSPRERFVDIVSLDWIVALPGEQSLRKAAAKEVCATYLESIERTMPRALPVRFDKWEPIEGKGLKNFQAVWQRVSEQELGGILHFSAVLPNYCGHIHFNYPRRTRGSPKHSLNCIQVSLNVDAASFATADADADATTAFSRVAANLNAIYGAAHCLRNWGYHRGELWVGQTTERTPQLTRDGWIGLPPTPAWMIWMHAAYLREMPDWLSANPAVSMNNGRAFKFGRHPCTAEEAKLSMPPIPEDLQFGPGQETNTGHNHGAIAAFRIPPYDDFIVAA